MKLKKLWSIFISVVLFTFIVGCNKNLTKGELYNITTTQVEHATFKVLNRDQSVDKAVEGQKLFVSIVFEEGYELDKVYVNNSWYIIDATSDGVAINDEFEILSYKYFLIDEETMNLKYTPKYSQKVICDKLYNSYTMLTFSFENKQYDYMIENMNELIILIK